MESYTHIQTISDSGSQDKTIVTRIHDSVGNVIPNTYTWSNVIIKDGKALVDFEYFKKLMCEQLGYGSTISYNSILKIEIARQRWQLDSTQVQCLRKLINITANNSSLNKGTTLFAFEGADNVTNAWNTYHPYGEFNAMLVVVKDGEITYITKNGSTLPSFPEGNRDNVNGHAVLREGIYDIEATTHKVYSAMKVNNSGTSDGMKIPVYRYGKEYKNADGVDIHAAGYKEKVHYSTGCITIAMSDYIEFGKQVGFIAEELNLTWNGTDEYSDFTNKIGTKYTRSFSGKFVFDRSVLRANLARDRGTARVSEDMYNNCMKYYFGVS